MLEPIQLLVTLDRNYLPQLRVLLTSARLNNPGERFGLFLLHKGLPREDLSRLEQWCRQSGWTFSPMEVDDTLFQNAPVSAQYPREMYYRLLAPHLLPEPVRRVLYLDPDILVLNPLRSLWETDLAGRLLAAAAHTGKTRLANDVNRIRLGTNHDYYNSGVLLMDLARGRTEILPQILFDYVRDHGRELLLPDQDLLNALYGDRVLPVEDVLWNYDARNFSNYLLRSSGAWNVPWVMEHTAILHFCGKAKPWKPNYFYRFGVLYQHYQQLARRAWAD